MEKDITFWRKTYKSVSLVLAVIFGIVGLIFLFMPVQVVHFFNSLAPRLGLPAAPEQGIGFYLILAVAYMYLVTLLALMMYKQPENKTAASLLVNAKAMSSVISLYLFIVHGSCLIYLANAITDGSIALAVFWLSRKI